MLLLIIWAVVIALLILTLVITKLEKKALLIAFTVISGCLLLFYGMRVLDENKTGYNANREVWEMRRAPLAYQVDEKEIDGALASAIAEFNVDLAKEKARNQSIWTNWLVGDYIEEIDYIQMPTMKIMK